MLLIISNSQDVTADYLVDRIVKTGPKIVRLDTDNFVANGRFEYRIGLPRLLVEGNDVRPEEFSTVWYRRPERLKCSKIEETPEGKVVFDEWAEALEAFFAHIPTARWINHPSANAAASHKLEQLTTAAQVGFSVPRTLVTQDEPQLRRFFDECDGRLIAKPMSVGHIERSGGEHDSLIYTNQVSKDHLGDLSDLCHCPTLFQEFVQKAADVRITVVDEEIHAVELVALDPDGSQRCDVRRNNMDDVTYRSVALPPNVDSAVRAIMKRYGLRFGAIDMAVTTNGKWVFFEINPNGQWAWLDLVGGQDIASSFIRSFKR
jgi:glutathione synthase/RimK-type ligase-like ATP-grasp enzyme